MSYASNNGTNNQHGSTSTETNTTTPLPTQLDDSSNYRKRQSQSSRCSTIQTKNDADKESDSSSDSDDDAGLACPICHGVMTDPFVTRCGHSYCHSCIIRHLDKQKWCPICRGALQDNDTCPNYNLNKIIERKMAKPKPRSRSTRSHANLKTLTDYLDTLPYTEDVLSVLNRARNKRKKVILYEETIQSSLLFAFLSMVEDYAAQKATKWKRYQDLTFQDKCKLSIQQPLRRNHHVKQSTDTMIQTYDDYSGGKDDHVTGHDSNNYGDDDDWNNSDDQDSDDGYSNGVSCHEASGNSINRRSKKRKQSDDKQIVKTPLAVSKELEHALATRRRRISPHFSGLMDFYFTERQRPTNDLAKFSSTLYQLTLYSHWVPLDTIHYTDLSMTSSIVSSIEFDRDEDHFAVGGVNREIKFYDYNMLNDSLDERLTQTPSCDDDDDDQENPNSQDLFSLPYSNSATINNNNTNHGSSTSINSSVQALVHCPLSIIPCEHKISCLSWNPYIKSRLASSDYDGVVNIWDTNTGQNVRAYREHRQRAWSVDTCASNPLMMASASDDSCVKIWSIHEKKSLLTLTQRGNVCCAKFAPNNQHLLAVGSADHRITCYDLRNTNNPLQIFSGHNKAVSYVKWNSDDEMTSASTDNTLKLWKLGASESIRTYTGHRNEKNFVGLSLNDNWISCGSENNTVYTYHKNSSHPVAQYKFNTVDPITGREAQNEDALFVSSVCWKRDSMKLLASNSKGVIKVLQLVE